MSITELRSIDNFTGEYRFLSNFYPSAIRYEQIMYPALEHAYQAAKAPTIREKRLIAAAASAGHAKRMGQKVALPKNWESVKVGIMRELVRIKFTKYPELRRRLIETGELPLIEENTWGDRFWGTCGGIGQNHLGRILMEIRNELRD